MPPAKKTPPRQRIKPSDTWDLSSLFESDGHWEKAFDQFQRRIGGYKRFQGKLRQDTGFLAACLKFDSRLDRLGERLGTYAFLKSAEDQANSAYQRMLGRYRNAARRAAESSSFIRPELLAIPMARMKRNLLSKEIAPYRLMIERLLRFKKFTLGEKEEEILAMQAEMAQAASRAFRQLLDSDMKFGFVSDERGRQIELTHATLQQLLISPRRSVRKNAFHQYYEQIHGHENTLAATLSSSIETDVYYARVRGYDSSLDAALFPDNVPRTVYERLIASVRRHLPALQRYYDLRRRKMNLRDIHHYDTYVPIIPELESRRSWRQATETVITALAPLGEDYCHVLEQGLTGRWCDRYPNRGKQSGAFSCGSYDGNPYILMNYKPEVLDDMFTLAHEAGHSMHSYYSARHQPFEYYNYSIFVAEVASTFNEQLLSRHLMQQARDDKTRAYLINRDIDAVRGTIFRQTMFAEFEKTTHEMAEAGEPLTVKALRTTYAKLLSDYFGPDFTLDEQLELEGLRIPHFYRAFYVYKYATGMSAAMALCQRVVDGGPRELNDYLGFLKGGCSKFPLDLLRDAGVDMTTPRPVDSALHRFEQLLDELEELL